MDKFCVFCGKKPEGKNKEHVLPQWLLSLTGDPNRIASFSSWTKEHRQRKFSFNAFTFPACGNCNEKFGKLEAQNKIIMSKLLQRKPISALEFHYLLDWFDKVRIGLWLGFYYLDENRMQINPRFHIETRVRIHDRMLFIIRLDENINELSFRGVNLPIFYLTPSCFSMTVNNLCFINMSAAFLFARRIGFPYPIKSYWEGDGLIRFAIVKGIERHMVPLIKKSFGFLGTGIYQPIFAAALQSPITRNGINPYDNEFVKNSCLYYSEGIGNIFLEIDGKIIPYPNDESMLWIPTTNNSRLLFTEYVNIVTLELQLFIDSLNPSYDLLDLDLKKHHKAIFQLSRSLNRDLIDKFKRQIKYGYI
jgi:hypothetical protein